MAMPSDTMDMTGIATTTATAPRASTTLRSRCDGSGAPVRSGAHQWPYPTVVSSASARRASCAGESTTGAARPAKTSLSCANSTVVAPGSSRFTGMTATIYRRRPASLGDEHGPGQHADVGLVGEDAVNAGVQEDQVLLDRAAVRVGVGADPQLGRQELVLRPERVGVQHQDRKR